MYTVTNEEHERDEVEGGATSVEHGGAGSGGIEQADQGAEGERPERHATAAQLQALSHMSQGERSGAQEQERQTRMRASGAEHGTIGRSTDAAGNSSTGRSMPHEDECEESRRGDTAMEGGRSEEDEEEQQHQHEDDQEERGGSGVVDSAGTEDGEHSSTATRHSMTVQEVQARSTPGVRGVSGNSTAMHSNEDDEHAAPQHEEVRGNDAAAGSNARTMQTDVTTAEDDDEEQRSREEDSIRGTLAQTRPKRATKCVERLGVVADVPRTRPRPAGSRRAKPTVEIRYMERHGAHGGELRYLVRIGKVTIRRIEHT